MGDVDNGGEDRGRVGISVSFPQYCCEPKAALKK